MKQIFEEQVLPYNLRRSDKLQLSKAKTTGLGLDTIKFVGEKCGRHYHQNRKNQTPLKFWKGL